MSSFNDMRNKLSIIIRYPNTPLCMICKGGKYLGYYGDCPLDNGGTVTNYINTSTTLHVCTCTNMFSNGFRIFIFQFVFFQKEEKGPFRSF